MNAEKTLPTPSELLLLQSLWSDGPQTVRQLHEQTRGRESDGYTTTLKLLQIMHQKGLVNRDESNRSHVYRAALNRRRVQKTLLRTFVDNVFDGSMAQLMVGAVSNRQISPEDLAEIKKLLTEGES